MEKSIEEIWKEGFLEPDALIAPKVNELYGKKSIHIIDKFKRMFKINLIAIVVFSIVFLGISFIVGIPLMGAMFFVALMVLVLINRQLLKGLDKIDKGENSYQYLIKFNDWINWQVSVNRRMSTILYPVFFISFIIGFWFKDAEGMYLGNRLMHKITSANPDLSIIFGIPSVVFFIIMLITGLLAFFGGRIYMWDVNMVYGRVFKKLKELLNDIESINT